MKKISYTTLSLMFVLLLGLGVLAPVASAKTEIKWLQWKTSEVGEEVMKQLKQTFEKQNPDITVTIVDSPFMGFYDKAVSLYRAGKSPDVLLCQLDWLAEFAEMGMLTPFDPFIKREAPDFMDQYYETFRKKWKGHQYYLPLYGGCVGLFYNKDIFKAAGIGEPPGTWDELVKVAKAVTKPEKNQYAFTCTLQVEPPTNLTYDIFPLIYQAGGDVVDDKTHKAVFNSEAGVKAIEFYIELVNKHKISVPGVLSNGEKEKRGNFGAGNIAMMFEGPWGVPIQRGLNPNLNFDIAPLPKGVTTGTTVRGGLVTITSQSKNPEAAWKFVKFLTGPVGAEIYCKGSGDMPANKIAAEKPFVKENKLAQAFLKQMALPNAKAPALGLPNGVELGRVLTMEIQNAVLGKKSAKQALDDAAAKWNEVLDKYY